MKSLASFLSEGAGNPASQVGKDRLAKQRAQNEQNREHKAAAKGADAVKAKQDKLAKERAEADAAAKKLEAQVKKYQPERNAADKAAKEVEAKVRSQTKEKEEKKPAGPSKPLNDKPSGKIDTTKRAKQKTSTQIDNLNKDRTSASGRIKRSMGGDMVIKDKKTDTKDTRDYKKRTRNNARLDAAQKAAGAAGSALKKGLAMPQDKVDAVPDQAPESKATQTRSYQSSASK